MRISIAFFVHFFNEAFQVFLKLGSLEAGAFPEAVKAFFFGFFELALGPLGGEVVEALDGDVFDAGAGTASDEENDLHAVGLGGIRAGFGAYGDLVVAFALEVIANDAFGALALSLREDGTFDEANLIFEVGYFIFRKAAERVFGDAGALGDANDKPDFFLSEAVGQDFYIREKALFPEFFEGVSEVVAGDADFLGEVKATGDFDSVGVNVRSPFYAKVGDFHFSGLGGREVLGKGYEEADTRPKRRSRC